jgi:hypothetical protein
MGSGRFGSDWVGSDRIESCGGVKNENETKMKMKITIEWEKYRNATTQCHTTQDGATEWEQTGEKTK